MSLVVLTGEVGGRWKRVQTAAFKYKQVLDLYQAECWSDDSELLETLEERLEFENLEQVLDLYQAEWRRDDSELLDKLEKHLDGLFENLEAAYLCWLRAKLGYQAVAVSGRPSMEGYLRELGAVNVIDRAELDRDPRPLDKELYSAGIDCVGSKTLATLLSQTRYEGIVAACGLAGGADLPATVMPFILRGVTLRGIDSVMAEQKRRQRAWDDLARLVDPAHLADVFEVRPMSQIPALATELLDGKLRGRIVVDVNA